MVEEARDYVTPCGGEGWLLGRKAIAATAHCVDEVVMPGRRQGRAQAPDMHIHRAFLDENVIASDKIQQLGARVDPLKVGEEKMQQAELGRSHGKRFALPRYLV